MPTALLGLPLERSKVLGPIRLRGAPLLGAYVILTPPLALKERNQCSWVTLRQAYPPTVYFVGFRRKTEMNIEEPIELSVSDKAGV